MRRARSHSDPSSPPSAPFHASSPPSHVMRNEPQSRSRYRLEDRLPHLTSESSNSSLQSAFSGLTLTGQNGTPREGRGGERYLSGSPTPSVTSVSEDEMDRGEWKGVEVEEGLKRWIGRGGKGKGKGRAVEGDEEEGMGGRSPPEVLAQVSAQFPTSRRGAGEIVVSNETGYADSSDPATFASSTRPLCGSPSLSTMVFIEFLDIMAQTEPHAHASTCQAHSGLTVPFHFTPLWRLDPAHQPFKHSQPPHRLPHRWAGTV